MQIIKKHSNFPGILLILWSVVSCGSDAVVNLDLAGSWQFKMDTLDVGEKEAWYNIEFNDQIHLPGSMAENGKGFNVDINTHWTGNMWNDSLWYKSKAYKKYRQPDNTKVSFWLTPEKKYYGAAWYRKQVNIPKKWDDKIVILNLERPHWETTLWIDDQLIGTKNKLATSHQYDITEYTKSGLNKITLKVDNRIKEINVGRDAHSITDNTQTNWNGIVGNLQLMAKPKIYMGLVKVIPNVKKRMVTVIVEVENPSQSSKEFELNIGIKNSKSIPLKQERYTLDNTKKVVAIGYSMGDNVKLWDEHHPNLYTMEIELNSSFGKDKRDISFGMREFKANKKQFEINGHPVFLRGTLECAIFPKTGYPPTTTNEWLRIFKVLKQHGLNHMRFHSWCPPKAAFTAADQIGIYLQVEASSWTTIGNGKPIDKWIYKEAQAILDSYGNHPSFVMMAYGNEPHGANHKTYLEGFVNHFKAQDSTKLYTGAAGWPFLDSADYFNSPKPRIQQWAQGLNSIINSKAPQTTFDYSEIIQKTPMPYVSHEIGQWCVYPNFKEIQKYTGVLKPKNFEIFKDKLEENNLAHLSDSLLLASGKLQALCYKADIEAALRTKDFAGFQLLDLHDFPGQGTALVGVLDAFWEEKSYISPDEFNAFCGKTVPLTRLEKRIFSSRDTLNASIEIAHYDEKPIKAIVPKWALLTTLGNTFCEGILDKTNIAVGNGISLGSISVPLNGIKKPQKLTLKVSVADKTNSWDIWVYPEIKDDIRPENQIHVTDRLDSKTKRILNTGGTVLLNITKGAIAHEKGGNIAVGFSSIFWNTSWTNNQAPHTLGILCDPKHPALEEFPTEYHSNWQWWDSMSHSNAVVLDDMPKDLKPIVHLIDDWFKARKTALIFEAKVGNGKLLFSGIDLHTNIENRLEAQQLLYSLKTYMNSDAFQPKVALKMSAIESLFKT